MTWSALRSPSDAMKARSSSSLKGRSNIVNPPSAMTAFITAATLGASSTVAGRIRISSDIVALVIIRPAVIADHGALEALQRRASLANAGDRDAILSHPDAIDIPREQIEARHVFVADSGGTVAGFAAVVPHEDGVGMELDALFVEPGGWRRGVGRRLVEHCAGFARTRGATTLHVIGNLHAEGFYRACGFEGAGTIATRFGDGLDLGLRL